MIRNVGNIIEILKKGEVFPEKHHNPYLKEALDYDGILFTTLDLESKSSFLYGENKAPLVIEIGCYLGKNLIEMAQANPLMNFLGLDITYKRVVKTARKIHRLETKNAFVGICDGNAMLDFVEDNSVTGVCVFFPDPWAKSKQQKHRLLNDAFFEKLVTKLAPGGFFWFKTDHQDYFQDTIALVKNYKFESQRSNPPELIKGGPFVTMFEKMFNEKNQPTYEITYFKTTKTS